ncbi:MAG: OmpA family protein [Hyphomicrobiales bacterium]|nr:OmpA family protein [Hyphomicrobiales bacterium]
MIIIKKIKKADHAAHGGAWKVAYADFVTAMMAFFLLLWLLNAVSQEQLQGISDYFAPISTRASTSGGGGLMAGQTIDSSGVFNATKRQTHTFAQFDRRDTGEKWESRGAHLSDTQPEGENSSSTLKTGEGEDDAENQAALAAEENRQFQLAQEQLREAVAVSPELSELASSLIIDVTPEGLRIQIVDQDGLPMFPRGSATMYTHTQKLIEKVAGVVAAMPQLLEISGHTDAMPFQSKSGYSNWELSSDRAQAARRALIEAGIIEGRTARVVAKAATEPLDPEHPNSPANRRLSILVLRGTHWQEAAS